MHLELLDLVLQFGNALLEANLVLDLVDKSIVEQGDALALLGSKVHVALVQLENVGKLVGREGAPARSVSTLLEGKPLTHDLGNEDGLCGLVVVLHEPHNLLAERGVDMGELVEGGDGLGRRPQ